VLCQDTARFQPTNFHPPSQFVMCLGGVRHALKGAKPLFPGAKTSYTPGFSAADDGSVYKARLAVVLEADRRSGEVAAKARAASPKYYPPPVERMEREAAAAREAAAREAAAREAAAREAAAREAAAREAAARDAAARDAAAREVAARREAAALLAEAAEAEKLKRLTGGIDIDRFDAGSRHFLHLLAKTMR
jgi:hypothetical protein